MLRTVVLFFMLLIVAEARISRNAAAKMFERARENEQKMLSKLQLDWGVAREMQSQENSVEESGESGETSAEASAEASAEGSSSSTGESGSGASSSTGESGSGASSSTGESGSGASSSTGGSSASSSTGGSEAEPKPLFTTSMTFSEELNSTQLTDMVAITQEKVAASLTGVNADDIIVTITKKTSRRRLLSVEYTVTVTIKASAYTPAVAAAVTSTAVEAITANVVTAAAEASLPQPTFGAITVTVVPDGSSSTGGGSGGGDGGNTKYSAADRTSLTVSVALIAGLVSLL